MCESVAWMKSPGSIIFSRATVWQMPGDTPSFARNARTPVASWKARCRSLCSISFGRNFAYVGISCA